MTDLIKNIQSEIETNEAKNSDDEENSDEDQDIETTSSKDVNDFNEWVRNEASRTYQDQSWFRVEEASSNCDGSYSKCSFHHWRQDH